MTTYAQSTTSVIVKLKNQHTLFTGQPAIKNGLSLQKRALDLKQKRKIMVETFVRQNRLQLKHTYDTVLFGFATEATPQQLIQLKKSAQVEAIIPDQILHITGKNKHKSKKSKAVDWPQVIPQGPVESGAADSSYRGNSQHVYVIDTGVDVNLKDIKGNLGLSYAPIFCHWPADANLCPMPYSDDNLHGTHVAGTVAAIDNRINALGVAPQATIHAVKVCTYDGSCPTSAILAGLNWAVFDMLGHGKPAVTNLSLGGGTDMEAGTCTEDGYEGDNFVAESYCNAAHQGMIVVVAAGNSADNAASYIPAYLDSTITVSAYKYYDSGFEEAQFSYFTNYGSGENSWSDRLSGVITIAAPGSDIVSLNRTHANLTISGTSMASPAVAGAAALILEKYPQQLDFSAFLNVRQMLVDNAATLSYYETEQDPDGVVQDFPHAEGLLNVRFLDETDEPDESDE